VPTQQMTTKNLPHKLHPHISLGPEVMLLSSAPL
jgi:hypothetical protein